MAKTAAVGTAAQSPVPGGPFELPPEAGQEAALRLHEPEARALDGSRLVPFKADALLAYYNARVSDESMAGAQESLRRKAPWAERARLTGLASVALAVVAATARVDRFVPAARGVAGKLARARKLRKLFLRTMQAAAEAGVVEERRVERIAKGVGAPDSVQDLADLAAMYREKAAELKGHTFVTADLLAEAETLAGELQGLLRPKGARRTGSSQELKDALELRARLWTLLVQRHTEARELAPMLFGLAQADAKVPALQSRVGAKRAKKKAGGAKSPDASAGTE